MPETPKSLVEQYVEYRMPIGKAKAIVEAKTRIIYDYMALVGAELLEIEYAGQGDCGDVSYIAAFGPGVPPDGIRSELDVPSDVSSVCRSLAYDLLQIDHPGWEINEGSEGKYVLSYSDRGGNFEVTNTHCEYVREENSGPFREFSFGGTK